MANPYKGGAYSVRKQSFQGSGGGWGGHTMSKSFTQLNVDSQYHGSAYATHRPATRPAEHTTVAKERYVGTGPSQSRRYSSGDALKQDHRASQREEALRKDTLVRNHTITGHRETANQSRAEPRPMGDSGGLRKWGTMSLSTDRKGEPSAKSVERSPPMPSQDQGFYTRSVTYSRDDSRLDPPNVPFQRYHSTDALSGKALHHNQMEIHVARAVHTTDDRSTKAAARDINIRGSAPDHRGDMILTGPDQPDVPSWSALRGPQSPVPKQPEDHRRSYSHHDRARPASSAKERPASSMELDLHLYDYIRHFNAKELSNIKSQGRMEETVILTFQTPFQQQADSAKSALSALVHPVRSNVCVERLDVSRFPDHRLLAQRLKDDFNVLVIPVNETTIEVVCHQKDLERIKSAINNQIHSSAIPPVKRIARTHNYTTAGTLDVRSNFKAKGYLIYGMVKVYLHVCDITVLHMDTIVNASNPQLQHVGGVAKAIADAAGHVLTAACDNIVQKLGPITVSEIAQTTGGNLPCGSVLHAVGPRWPAQADSHQKDQTLKLLRQTYDNIMGFACQSGIETIALPPISSGVYGIPHNHVTEAIYGALATGVLKFFFNEENNLKEIHLVDIGPDILQRLDQLFANGCQAEGQEVLRQIPDIATNTAVAKAKSPKEHLMPPLHFGLVKPEHFEPQRNEDMSTAQVMTAYVMNTEESSLHDQFQPHGYLLFGMFSVFIHQSNIVDMEVDAIVLASDGYLSHHTGASESIAVAAGPDMGVAIEEFLRVKGSLPLGQVMTTRSGHLSCESVLHVALPQWPGDQAVPLQERCLQDLRRAFDNVIAHVCRSGIETIAIPADPGLYRVPYLHAVETIYESILYQLREHFFNNASLKEIHITDSNPDVLMRFVQLFENDIRASDARGASVSVLDRSIALHGWYKRNKSKSDLRDAAQYRSMERQTTVPKTAYPETSNPMATRESVKQWGQDTGSSHSSDGVRGSPAYPERTVTKKVTIKEKKNNPFSCCYSNYKPPPKHQISVIEHPHFEDHDGHPTRPVNHVAPERKIAYDEPDRYSHATRQQTNERQSTYAPTPPRPQSAYHAQSDDRMAQNSYQGAPPPNQVIMRKHQTYGGSPRQSHDNVQQQSNYVNRQSHPRPENSSGLVVRHSYQSSPASPNQYSMRNVHADQDWHVGRVDRASRAGQSMSRAGPGTYNDGMAQGPPSAYSRQDPGYGSRSVPY